jgi:hypothetical protein
VSFLDTVQWAGVDLLSISWQLGLGRVGQGGTADIFQSLVDVNTTMTFKRWSKDLTESDVADKARLVTIFDQTLRFDPKARMTDMISLRGLSDEEWVLHPHLLVSHNRG